MCLVFYTWLLSSKRAIVNRKRIDILWFSLRFFALYSVLNPTHLPLCSWCPKSRRSLSGVIVQGNLWLSARERNVCLVACCGEITWWEVLLHCKCFVKPCWWRMAFRPRILRVAEHTTLHTRQIRLITVTCTHPERSMYCTTFGPHGIAFGNRINSQGSYFIGFCRKIDWFVGIMLWVGRSIETH